MPEEQKYIYYASGFNVEGIDKMPQTEILKEKGFDIDRKTIVVSDAKQVGTYKAVVKLHKEVSVEIPFEVVAEE